VTVGQFRKFVDATGYRTVAERDGKGAEGYDAKERTLRVGTEFNWRNPGFSQNDDHPVVCVTWDDAGAFCQWLSRRKGDEYRLPTEAEWEYACRAGSTTAWTSGDDGLGLQTTANIADESLRSVFSEKSMTQTLYERVAWSDGHAFTAPVGSLRPNAFGLYDMEGNVREHCQDWFDSPYETASLSVDPAGPRSSIYGRVQRGGAWSFGPSVARCASRARLWERPDRCYCDTGFRVARTIHNPR
jgi:formylglycine-generating enzyme required for sulfatase activity